jgi:hypothetical protein
MAHAVLAPGDARRFGVVIVRRDVVGLVDRQPAKGLARIHQVVRDLGLAVDHHALAVGQPVEVDARPGAAERQLDAVVQQAFPVHACPDARLVEQIDGRLLEHACTNAAEHVLGAAALENHVVDAGVVQQVPEQQPGGACANDRDLGTLGNHGCPS